MLRFREELEGSYTRDLTAGRVEDMSALPSAYMQNVHRLSDDLDGQRVTVTFFRAISLGPDSEKSNYLPHLLVSPEIAAEGQHDASGWICICLDRRTAWRQVSRNVLK
jgi:hypothetical protein